MLSTIQKYTKCNTESFATTHNYVVVITTVTDTIYSYADIITTYDVNNNLHRKFCYNPQLCSHHNHCDRYNLQLCRHHNYL